MIRRKKILNKYFGITFFLFVSAMLLSIKIFLFVEFPVAPEISQPPMNATKVEGEDVVFSCSVDGNPSPVVTWTKNGEELNVAANSRINVLSTHNNHSLTITNVNRSDAGQYTCVASNSVSSSTSSAATLTVQCE